VAGLVVLLCGLLLRLAPLLETAGGGWLLLAGALAGLLAADVAGGVAHWFCDSFFEEDSFLVGPVFIAPFREHHADPQAMTRHGFLELNGNSAVVLSPLLAFALWQWPSGLASGTQLFAGAVLGAFSAAAFATNQLHCWAHRADAPAVVRWLQRRGVILSAAAHDRHHAAPHDRAFCVTTGWMNRPLESCGFFRVCARALRALGLPPARRGSISRGSGRGWSAVIRRRPVGAGRAS
jgi:ubiquitin-conjugating enzyme E2 variant